MVAISKIEDNKTVIPDEILEKIAGKGEIIKWTINEDGKIELEFVEEVRLEDLPEKCRQFYKELDELSAEIKAGNGIKLVADELEEKYGL